MPILASLAFSTVFIARTSFVVDGRRYFTLFDDAMISMRYARNLAEGHGLVWNAGQPPVEGYTNFLWTLGMALVHLLPVPEHLIALIVMAACAAILVGNLVIVRKVAVALVPDSPHAASTAVWLTAMYYPLIYWTLRGMEVGLVTLIVSTSMLFATRIGHRASVRNLARLAALFAAGILTRPDVAVPCVVVAACAVWFARTEDRVRVAVVLGAAIAGTIALHTGFRLWYYGDPLPNTYYLKVSGATLPARVARGLRGLVGVGLLHLLVPAALAAAQLVECGRRWSARCRGLLLPAALFLAACAYSAYVGGDAWDSMLYANRYVTPAVPGLLILAAIEIDKLIGAGSPARRPVVGVATLFVFAAALTAIAPIVTQGLAATTSDERLRIARVVITCVPVLLLPIMPRARSAAWAGLTIATIVAVNGLAFALWLGHNAFYADDDRVSTGYGLAIRAATRGDAVVAVTWAGAIPYFSHRTAIDMLGKSDRVVARRPRNVAAGFDPGHDKWDYGYSIGELRPDLVAQLWHASADEQAAIERSGYVALAPWTFVRADSMRVDRDAAGRAACAVLADDPFVLGSAMREFSDRDHVVARYCRE